MVLARHSADGPNAGLARAALGIGVLALLADLAAMVADGVSNG